LEDKSNKKREELNKTEIHHEKAKKILLLHNRNFPKFKTLEKLSLTEPDPENHRKK
jgi:hypothetical protein